MFGIRRRGDDESASEADEGLVSDTAENEDSDHDSDVSAGNSVPDWGDWSVNNNSDNEDGEESAPLNGDDDNDDDGNRKGSVSTSDNELPSSQSGSKDDRGLNTTREMKSESDLATLKASKRKKKKKAKDTGEDTSVGDKSKNSSHDDDDSDKAAKKKSKKKKRSKSESMKDTDSISLLSADASAGDSTTLSPKQKSPHKKDKKKKKRESKLDGLPETPEMDAENDSEYRSRSRSSRTSKSQTRSQRGSKKDKLGRLDHVQSSSGVSLDTSLLENGNDAQSLEILRLHQMLSDALQKVASKSAEQINDKDQFLRVSTELSRLKADYEGIIRERNDLRTRLIDSEDTLEKSMKKIDNLEKAIEKQLDEQDRVEAKLVRSEDEVDKLLIEIQDLERVVDKSGGGAIDEAMRTELKELKKTMVDKQREIDDQKARIEHLEQELQQSSAVSKLQVDELEAEKKALDGKLKGERLEHSSKLALLDDRVNQLETELARYRGNSEYEEIAVVREEMERTKTDLAKALQDNENTKRLMQRATNEKDDLQEKYKVLTDKCKVLQCSVNELTEKSRDLGEKVLKWTEQTYEWKARAESAEKKVSSLAEASDVSDTGSATDEAPQGLFLQAAMDKKGAKKPNRWSIFGNGAEEEGSADEIRIKTLEARNQKLEIELADLKSEMVKLQSAHKEESYVTQKKLTQLQGENEALTVKNTALEAICAEK